MSELRVAASQALIDCGMDQVKACERLRNQGFRRAEIRQEMSRIAGGLQNPWMKGNSITADTPHFDDGDDFEAAQDAIASACAWHLFDLEQQHGKPQSDVVENAQERKPLGYSAPMVARSYCGSSAAWF